MTECLSLDHDQSVLNCLKQGNKAVVPLKYFHILIAAGVDAYETASALASGLSLMMALLIALSRGWRTYNPSLLVNRAWSHLPGMQDLELLLNRFNGEPQCAGISIESDAT